jgi:restriction system protein
MPERPQTTVSFADAAATVLQDANEPLHYREISKRIMERGLVKTDGKTPEYTVNAVMAVDLKRRGPASRFVRVRPGVFALREKTSQEDLPPEDSARGGDRKVRVPLFPTYDGVRAALRVWDGRRRDEIAGLRSTVVSLTGSPQDPVDWTDPDKWIPERLTGADRDLAEALWKSSGGNVNPRHVYGHWLLAVRYGLLRDESGTMHLTERGADFIEQPDGAAVQSVDAGEGVLKLLSLVAEKGPGRRSTFLEDWSDYLKRYSNFSSEHIIKDSMSRRLLNLTERELVLRSSNTYSITETGLAYLEANDGAGEGETPDEHQQLLRLAKAQQTSIRNSIDELLHAMDPIAFEHLIKRLLEAMEYDNVTVTAPSNDKGVDVVADIELGITSVREVVQAKRHRNRVQRKDLDALRGSLHRFGAVRGTIITTSDFSKGTAEAAFEQGAAPITLINGEKLIDLLVEHGIGVRKKVVELLEFDADAFAEAGDEPAEAE